ncbi:hypothetical protein RJ640_007025 [Escallonia rubra]|uniref:Reverse transcriptase Ty1/copia-type domain-containing protein n=1 Tax=Escallonia rubra TaxID=112253 RepID=A0AA88RA17_9ASTE|nr:hypothetical protein RJ640_007025 [Escallonia rubra]
MASSSQASQAPKYPFPSNFNVGNFVTLKLNDNNYLLWETQVSSLIESHDLLGFLTGDVPAPSKFIEENDGVQAPNPDYALWVHIYRLVKSWVIGTLSEDALGLTVSLRTAAQDLVKNTSLSLLLCYVLLSQAILRFDNNYQANDIPRALTAIHLSESQDAKCFPDSGATSHVTDDSGKLTNLIPYHGSETVMAGNGDNLAISRIENGVISTKSCNIPLKDVLVVPDIKKNLLFVSQLTQDYPCYFEFAKYGFSIKDQKTNQVLALGTRQGGLYGLSRDSSSTSPHPSPLACTREVLSSNATATSASRLSTSTDSSLRVPSLPSVTTSTAATHGMTTRSHHGISKPNPKYLHLTTLSIPSEPKTVVFALKHPGWKVAMEEEMNALALYHTWDLLHRSSSMNVIGCRWIFKTKIHSDGRLDRLKERLVAKGYTQEEWVDFTKTFSLVIRPGSIRTILTVVVVRDWPIRQLDVKNAFLHGKLDIPIFMEQPHSFIDP